MATHWGGAFSLFVSNYISAMLGKRLLMSTDVGLRRRGACHHASTVTGWFLMELETNLLVCIAHTSPLNAEKLEHLLVG